MKQPSNKLNLCLILVHVIAAWFFSQAFETLLALHELELIREIRETGKEITPDLFEKMGITGVELLLFNIWTNIGSLPGLMIAFSISMIICKRSGWYWLNALLVLAITYVLGWKWFPGFDLVKRIYYTDLLKFIRVDLLMISMSCIFLALGLLTFFSKISKRFILKGVRRVYQSEQHE